MEVSIEANANSYMVSLLRLSANTTKKYLHQSKTRLVEHTINDYSDIKCLQEINPLSIPGILVLHPHKLKVLQKCQVLAFSQQCLPFT